MSARTAPEGAVLVMHLTDGLAWCDSTCRRGELVVWPAWTDEPLPAMESARTKPILSMMGAEIASPIRRAVRDIQAVAR